MSKQLTQSQAFISLLAQEGCLSPLDSLDLGGASPQCGTFDKMQILL